MKAQWSQNYYNKTAQELPALREGNVARVKPNPCLIISKLGESSYLVDVNGKGYWRNCKFLSAMSELPNKTFENTAEETIKITKYEKENEAVIQPPSKGIPSWMNDVQKEKKRTGTKNNKLPSRKVRDELRIWPYKKWKWYVTYQDNSYQ